MVKFMKIKESFHTYAIITIIFWSLAYVLTRLALKYFSPFTLGFLRYFFASLTMAVIAIIIKMRRPCKKDIILFTLSGAFGFFLYMIAFNVGCKTVTASTSSVIIATVPVLTAVFAHLVYGEKLSALQWLATGTEFSGVAVLTLMNHVFSINQGIIWLLAAAVFLSIYNLLQRKLTKTYSGLEASAFSIFAGTLMLAVFIPSTVKDFKFSSPIGLLFTAVLGIFSSALAYAAWAEALKKTEKASSVSNYMFITPFLTSLLGFIIAGERPDVPTVVGGGIILLGFLIFNFGDKTVLDTKRKTAGHH